MFERLLNIYIIGFFYFFVLFPFAPVFTEHVPSQQALERSREANVLVAITVHFDSSRFQYLSKVLSSLSTFPRADIILVTNTFNEQELHALQSVYNEILPNGVGGGSVSIRSYGNLAHPFDLTWSHKEIIANEFVKNNNSYTHFIYLEDDIGFNFMNFCYFVEFREILRDEGLLPSFLRIEYSDIIKDFVNTDNMKPVNVLNQPHISFNDFFLVNLPNPYMACFVLDTELAAEYVLTRSFDIDKSLFHHWDVRERAAMGLCFENIPVFFQSRYVVPVSKQTGIAPNYAWISHLPNNYANNPAVPFGKIRMNSLFVLP